MASQFFKFPGFFSREIDLTAVTVEPVGVPAGVVGAAQKGPAFVPITIGSFSDFESRFGTLDPDIAGPYAVERFLQNRRALTYVRVLGAGSNETTADFDTTRTEGTVKNAGFFVSASEVNNGSVGATQFIVARHVVTASEAFGFPVFTNNDSYFSTGSSEEVYLVRGMLFAANDTRIQILDHDQSYAVSVDDYATVNTGSKEFKIVISSSAGTSFSNDDGFAGIKILTASLDPQSDNYFAKLLNTDPTKFGTEKHVVYADFAVDSAIATVGTGSNDVAIVSGSANTSTTSGDTSLPFLNGFGKFDTRYKTPRTTAFISQPFGDTEYDLFHFEALDDGAYANSKFKVSIGNLNKSSDPRNEYGTFSVLIRAFDDTDVQPQILEQFSNVSLDPESDNYIAKVIGDKKARFNFDVEDEDDRRLIIEGKFPNRSKLVRIVMNEQVEKKLVPATALPFGFRGPEILNTNSLLVDATGSTGFGTIRRLNASGSGDPRILGAIVPPQPYRFKLTRGSIKTTGGLIGAPGSLEVADSRYFWGYKIGKITNVLNPNVTTEENKHVPSTTQFLGLDKLDIVVTGSTNTDTFNSNKFTLARVAFGNTAISELTSSVTNHIREAAYIRNGKPDAFEYKITDGGTDRITLATLLQKGSTASVFNKYTDFTKFTNVMYGGWDGTNILDENAANLNDRSTSSEARGSIFGNTNASFTSPGFATNQNGTGTANNSVFSYRTAAKIITDPLASNVNLVAVPGQRDSLVADHFADRVKDFGLALYLMDIPNYDSSGDRIFDGESGVYVDVDEVADAFESRTIDNNTTAPYFPNFSMDDTVNDRRVSVPASVAALAAIGFNDRVSYPWFAPAGFNRASLDFVKNTAVRIRQPERERLRDVNINPIVKFPNEGFVIFSQETAQQSESALSSINVQRMIFDVQRQVSVLGNNVIFEQIDNSLYTKLDRDITQVLTNVQQRQGIDRFRVIVDNTNNTAQDREENRINVRVVLVPTRAIEFIAIDFIITRSGVQFIA